MYMYWLDQWPGLWHKKTLTNLADDQACMQMASRQSSLESQIGIGFQRLAEGRMARRMSVTSLTTASDVGGIISALGRRRRVTVVPGGPRIIIATSRRDFCIAGTPSTCNKTSPGCNTPLSAADEFFVNPATR
mmetsp:Transcript_34172/g.50054  ORF Transcript_34172/g.50054 Transcript_34172/m.50054 type:complete len:133 (-) Transcript_34172:243-641(-)